MSDIENEAHDPEGVLTDEEYHGLRFSQADVDRQIRELLESIDPLAWKSLAIDAVSAFTSADPTRIARIRKHGGDRRRVQISSYRVAEFFVAMDALNPAVLDRAIADAREARRDQGTRRKRGRAR